MMANFSDQVLQCDLTQTDCGGSSRGSAHSRAAVAFDLGDNQIHRTLIGSKLLRWTLLDGLIFIKDFLHS